MSLTFVNTSTIFDQGNMALGGAWGAAFVSLGSIPYLYVSGSSESGISAFAVSAAGQLINVGNIHDSDNAALGLGGTSGIASLSFGSNSYLYATGFTENAVTSLALGSDGSIGFSSSGIPVVRNGDLGSQLSGDIDVVGVTVGGFSFVVDAGYNSDTITALSVYGNGQFEGHASNSADNGYLHFDGVRSLATTVVGGTTYLVVAGQSDSGLTILGLDCQVPYGLVYTIAANISDDATVNLDGASAVATATVSGQTYIFAAGTVDHGLSVFHFQPGATPTNVFNIGDTATLHLQDVYDLVTADIAGTTYLFAASLADDGVSAFAVAPDGTLISMGDVADTPDVALNGAAQLATAVIGGHTYLAVTGQADSGVSLFRIDPAGFTITGTAGADLIDATHAPAHQLLPSQLGDIISGLGGNDVISGLGGGDTLNGNEGNDTLNGGTGADHMNGGTGNDIFVVDIAGDVLTDSGGIDRVISSVTRTLAAGFENLTLSGAANISGIGNTLANVIAGNGGNNTLSGLAGNDIVRGIGGNDTIRGGTGKDVLTGGPGNDFFVFDTAPSATNRDTITDFANASGNNDTIRLENAVFTTLGAPGALAAAKFFVGATAHDADDRIIYNHATGALFYDSNGDVTGGSIQFATLSNHATLTAGDFRVI